MFTADGGSAAGQQAGRRRRVRLGISVFSYYQNGSICRNERSSGSYTASEVDQTLGLKSWVYSLQEQNIMMCSEGSTGLGLTRWSWSRTALRRTLNMADICVAAPITVGLDATVDELRPVWVQPARGSVTTSGLVLMHRATQTAGILCIRATFQSES